MHRGRNLFDVRFCCVSLSESPGIWALGNTYVVVVMIFDALMGDSTCRGYDKTFGRGEFKS